MANFDEQAALHPASVDGGDLIDLGHQVPFYLPPTAPQDFRLEDIDNFSLGAVSQRDSDATDRSINGSSLPPTGDEGAIPADGEEAVNGLGNTEGPGEKLVAAGESAAKSSEAVKPKLKRMTKEEFEASLGMKPMKKTAKKDAVKKTPAKKAETKKGKKKTEKAIPKVAKGVKKTASKAAAKKTAKAKAESPKKTSVSFEEPKGSSVAAKKKTAKGAKKNQKKATKGILKKTTKEATKSDSEKVSPTRPSGMRRQVHSTATCISRSNQQIRNG